MRRGKGSKETSKGLAKGSLRANAEVETNDRVRPSVEIAAAKCERGRMDWTMGKRSVGKK